MIYKDGWVDMSEWIGRPLRRLPVSIRELDESLSHCSSITATTGDLWTDPRSGGIADVRSMAAIYGVGVQQFQRNILPKLDFVQWLGDIPVTNQNSAHADAHRYREAVGRERCMRLGIKTDCSSSGPNIKTLENRSITGISGRVRS